MWLSWSDFRAADPFVTSHTYMIHVSADLYVADS